MGKIDRSGVNNGNAKINKSQAIEIRRRIRSGESYKRVMNDFGLGQCQVYKIARKEHWAFDKNKKKSTRNKKNKR